MKQCFVGVGLAKDQKDKFTKYINHRRGKLPIKKVDMHEQGVTFGEVVAEVELLRRDGTASDDEGDEPEAEENSDDDDDKESLGTIARRLLMEEEEEGSSDDEEESASGEEED